MSAALTMQTRSHEFNVATLKYHTRYMCYVHIARYHSMLCIQHRALIPYTGRQCLVYNVPAEYMVLSR
jgi:hypothetical protein